MQVGYNVKSQKCIADSLAIMTLYKSHLRSLFTCWTGAIEDVLARRCCNDCVTIAGNCQCLLERSAGAAESAITATRTDQATGQGVAKLTGGQQFYTAPIFPPRVYSDRMVGQSQLGTSERRETLAVIQTSQSPHTQRQQVYRL